MEDFKAKLVSIKDLTHDVKQFMFETEEDFRFESGQFVMVKVDDGAEPLASRAYSIASAPDGSEFSLVIKLLPGGRGSEFLSRVSVEQNFDLKGPFGHFVLDKKSEKDLVFVATGTGVAPFHSMLVSLLEDKDPRHVTLLWGLRHCVDVFWRERFEELASEHANFDFKLTLSQPENESWDGLQGRVTDHLDGFDTANIRVYICGNKSMIDQSKEYFSEQGVPGDDIKNEIFY